MGRRRKLIEDDGDSSEDDLPVDAGNTGFEAFGVSPADLAEEAALFDNPYSHRKKRTKEDNIYGIFGESNEDERPRGQYSASRYTSGVNFVPSTATVPDNTTTQSENDESDDDVDHPEHLAGDPMDVDDNLGENHDDRGLNFVPRDESVDVESPSGLGFKRDKSPRLSTLVGSDTPPRGLGLPVEFPTAFGSSRTKKSLRDTHGKSNAGPSSPSPFRPVGREYAAFEAHTKGFGSKMLEKMGFKKGMGLGRDGSGIATPIDVKLRPTKAGLGLVDERSEALKREQRATGSEEPEMDRKDKKQGTRTGQWKRTAKKTKTAYKTAEELLAEQEGVTIPLASTSTQTSKIIDMTKKETRVLTSISEAVAATPAFDVTAARLPELRHNAQLLAELAQQDVIHMGRQIRMERARKEQAERQEQALRKQLDDERKRIARLKPIIQLANECANRSKEFARMPTGLNLDFVMNAFADTFEQLQTVYYHEYQSYRLDELVVASLAPIIKVALATWQPLVDPTFLAEPVRKWRRLMMPPQLDKFERDGPSATIANGELVNRPMTPYEAMLYNLWLPKVRQAINNVWDPKNPDSVIALLDAWHPPVSHQSTFHGGNELPITGSSFADVAALPDWLYENILDQLILPKLSREIDNWKPNQDAVPIHTWIHPWLPHLADELGDLFAAIRRKLIRHFKDWSPTDGSAMAILMPWMEVFRPADMEAIITKSILPKLMLHIRESFQVIPSAQDIQPLAEVLKWTGIVPSHLMVHLLETEFFPKWHRELWAWLSEPNANFEEITSWYRTWKSFFPPDLAKEAGIAIQFKAGLDMMNQRLAMGGASGPMPPVPPPIAQVSATAAAGGRVSAGTSAARTTSTMSAHDAFRDYVERKAAAEDLLFMPANRLHPTTGKALFRLVPASKPGGAGGTIVFLDEGVLFLEDGNGGWNPVGVDDAISTAARRK
ncbi:Tuftelin-interacting protein 11 [Gaertneriomyces sp. JEL0708]|nr:Tuftelin-interacting protein 11 [Gaertneriomyces sp. JEL0708]